MALFVAGVWPVDRVGLHPVQWVSHRGKGPSGAVGTSGGGSASQPSSGRGVLGSCWRVECVCVECVYGAVISTRSPAIPFPSLPLPLQLSHDGPGPRSAAGEVACDVRGGFREKGRPVGYSGGND